MKLKKIYSTRNHNSAVYSDLVYEWEDIFAETLSIPIYSYKKESTIRHIFFKPVSILCLSRLIQCIDRMRKPKKYTLVLELHPRPYFSFQVACDKIPYIIDFDNEVDIGNFYSVYRNAKLVLISSLQAYYYLKEHDCPLNIAHLPLSLSDKHISAKVPREKKEFDVIVTRQNKTLMKYLEIFAGKHSDFEYVLRQWDGAAIYSKNIYLSNKRGILGEYSDRKSYFCLLGKARVALYATPGIDEENNRFMNHVTPSLFEFLSAGCKVIARYPNNKETEYFCLGGIVPSVDSYNEFEELLTRYIVGSFSERDANIDLFLDTVRTSQRAIQLNTILGSQLQ